MGECGASGFIEASSSFAAEAAEPGVETTKKAVNGAQERCHFDNPTTHIHGACHHGEAA